MSVGLRFWIVHREVIGSVYAEVRGIGRRQAGGVKVRFGESLGYVVQMLCGDAAGHVIEAWPELWGEVGSLGAEEASMVHLGVGRL